MQQSTPLHSDQRLPRACNVWFVWRLLRPNYQHQEAFYEQQSTKHSFLRLQQLVDEKMMLMVFCFLEAVAESPTFSSVQNQRAFFQSDAKIRARSGWDGIALDMFNQTQRQLRQATTRSVEIPFLSRRIDVMSGYGNAHHDAFWKAFEEQRWETWTLTTFMCYIDHRTTVVDFGAWIGPTLLFHAHFSKRSFGIEADPVAFAVLQSNVRLNKNLSANIALDAGAIGVANHRVKMYSANAGNSCSGLGAVGCGAPKYQWLVATYTLQYMFDIHGIDVSNSTFIKIDVESYECELVSSLCLCRPYKKYSIQLPRLQLWLKHARSKPTILVAMHARISKCSEDALIGIADLIKSYKQAKCSFGLVWSVDGRLDCVDHELLLTDLDSCL